MTIPDEEWLICITRESGLSRVKSKLRRMRRVKSNSFTLSVFGIGNNSIFLVILLQVSNLAEKLWSEKIRDTVHSGGNTVCLWDSIGAK